MARKTLSILLALCMVLSLMPFGAFAAKNELVTYELTDELVDGAEYLIVNTNADGTAYAVTNPGSVTSSGVAMGRTEVTITDSTISTDAENVVWTATANGSGFDLTNDGAYLEGKSGGVKIYSPKQNADRSWTYSSANVLRHNNSYTLYYSSSNNAFSGSNNNTYATRTVFLFVKQGDIVPCAHANLTAVPAKAATATEAGYEAYWQCEDCHKLFSDAAAQNQIAAPVVIPATGVIEPGDYMIVISGQALTAARSSEAYVNSGYGTQIYTYTGLEAVAYTEGMVVAPDMVWSITAVEGGYAISNGANRLGATYVTLENNGGANGDLNVGSAEDVWTLSDGKLVSTTAGKQLQYETAQNMFTVRSTGGAVSLVPVDADDVCQHDDVDVVGAVDATCTEDGYTGDLACTACGEVFEAGEVIPALGHNWGEWVVTTPAGDTTPGEQTRTCARCGETETQEIEPLNAPTYEQADRLVAGVQYLIVSTNEDGTAYVLTKDNAAIGSKEVTIANGKIKVVAPEALWTATANGERFDLTNEGAYLEGKGGNLGIFATQQYPSRNWTYTDSYLEFVGGSYTYELYYENGFTARSFNTGSATHPVYLFALEGAVQPCQHEDVDLVNAVAATCTEAGYSGDLVCTACGEVFEEGEVIPALGHDWSDWTVTTPAGEYTPGEETRTCSRCDAEETREIEPLHVPTYVQVDRLVDGVEYLIVSTNQDGTAYVLTNPGATTSGASMGATEVTIADGKITGYHDGVLWLATANGNGFDLTNEGGYLEGKSGNVMIYSTQQYPNRSWAYSDSYLEHLGGTYSYEVYHNGTSFTFAQYNATTGAPSHPVYLFALEGAVQPCQHENLIAHAAKAATCTENGNDAYWECEDCHKLFSDAAAQTEIEEPVVYIALGHNWGDWEAVTAAGATTPGSEKRVCSRCGEEATRATDPTGILEPGTYVIVIGGNAVTTVRSANTAQGGTTEYQYTGMDGVPYVDGETEATAAMIWTVEAVDGGYVIRNGENYLNGTYAGTVGDLAVSDQSDVWTIDSTRLKSTNASAGNSGKFLGYVIPKDLFTMRSYRPESPDADLQMDVIFYPVEAVVCDHASTETRGAVEATCTEDGFTGDVYCTACGEKIADGEAIPALGHSWDEGVVTQQPTGSAEGVKTFTCTRCGEKRTEPIPKLVNPFVDVFEGRYYYNAVLWAFYRDPQITDGVDATHFMPDRICTRAHVVTFLWRANGCPEPNSMTSKLKDVQDPSKYYYKAVLWAAEQGITTGYDDGTFRPDAECTRGQVVTFLWRANGSPKPASAANPFTDVSPSAYNYDAILWAYENGITDGRTPTTFAPNDACTRGHVVTFLYRSMT